MDIAAMIQEIKAHPEYSKVGMILCHNGVVRKTTREGVEVTGLQVSVNHEKLDQIIEAQKKRPGIVEVLVRIEEGRPLKVGEDIMAIIVAGDIRETVIATLTDTLNQVKAQVTSKQQFYR